MLQGQPINREDIEVTEGEQYWLRSIGLWSIGCGLSSCGVLVAEYQPMEYWLRSINLWSIGCGVSTYGVLVAKYQNVEYRIQSIIL